MRQCRHEPNTCVVATATLAREGSARFFSSPFFVIVFLLVCWLPFPVLAFSGARVELCKSGRGSNLGSGAFMRWWLGSGHLPHSSRPVGTGDSGLVVVWRKRSHNCGDAASKIPLRATLWTVVGGLVGAGRHSGAPVFAPPLRAWCCSCTLLRDRW